MKTGHIKKEYTISVEATRFKHDLVSNILSGII